MSAPSPIEKKTKLTDASELPQLERVPVVNQSAIVQALMSAKVSLDGRVMVEIAQFTGMGLRARTLTSDNVEPYRSWHDPDGHDTDGH
jgi:hypothetical protein